MSEPQDEAVRAGNRACGSAGDLLGQVKASGCHAADTCIMDAACPFAADCRRIEED